MERLSKIAATALLCFLLAPAGHAQGFPNVEQPNPGQRLAGPFSTEDRCSMIFYQQGYLWTNPQSHNTSSGTSLHTRQWDISDLSDVQLVGTTQAMGGSSHVSSKSGNFLFMDSDGLDVSDPNNPIFHKNIKHRPYHPWIITRYTGYGNFRANASLRLRSSGLAFWDAIGQSGVIGMPFIIGDQLVYADVHAASGVAVFDISNPNSPQLQDVIPNLEGYQSQVYRHYVILSQFKSPPTRRFIHIVDYSDPTDLKLVRTLTDTDDGVAGYVRYIQFQDEYMFVGRSKIDTRTWEVDLVFNADDFLDTGQFFLPLGNLVATGGLSGYMSIFAHQTAPDTRGPYVGYHIPRDGQTNYSTRTPITLLIHETLLTNTIVSGTSLIVRPVGGSPISGDIQFSDSDVLTFTPSQELQANTTYEVILPAGGIKDAAGNGMQPYSFRFSTGATIDDNTNPRPTAVIDTPAVVVQAETAIHFDATPSSDSNGSIVAYHWDFGDGGTATGATPQHTFQEPREYEVKLTVTDDEGMTRLETLDMTVTPPDQRTLIAVAQASPDTEDVFQSITFTGVNSTDSDGTITAYDWDFGDGALDSGATVTHNFGSAGTKTVTLTVTNDAGQTATDTVTVHITLPGHTPFIAGELLTAPASINLNTEGSIDWIHFGRDNANATNRKNTTSPSFGDVSVIGGGSRKNNNDFYTQASWSNGDPTSSASNIQNSIYNDNFDVLGSGFSWTIQASSSLQEARLYLGTFNGRGKLTATIGDVTYTSELELPTTFNNQHRYGVYSLKFGGAGIATEINLTWELIEDQGNFANVQIMGGTLKFASNLRPEITAITTLPHPTTVGGTVSITAEASDPEGHPLEYRFRFGDSPFSDWQESPTTNQTYQSAGHFSVTAQARDLFLGLATRVTEITVVDPPTLPRPGKSSPIISDATARRVWTVNPDNNTVTAVDADTLGKLWEVPVANDPRSLALAADNTLWITCYDEHVINIIDATTGASIQQIALDYGDSPVGIVMNQSQDTAYVTLEGSGALLRLNTATRVVTGVLPLGVMPRALALTGDDNTLLVTHFLASSTQATVSQIDTASFTLSQTIALTKDTVSLDTDDSGRGVPNYLAGITIAPNHEYAWITSKKDNIDRGLARDGLDLAPENTVRTILSEIDLSTSQETFNARRDINDSDSLTAIEFSPLGNYAFVAVQGNNEIAIFDRLNNNTAPSTRIATGLAPQGLTFDSVTNQLFVKNFMDRSITVLDADPLLRTGNLQMAELATIDCVANETLSAEVLLGKQIFYNANDPRMSLNSYISCATCHADGGHDAQVWDFTGRGEGFRNTTTLRGRSGLGHGPVHWTGNFDEIQDFENDIRNAFGGTGFMSDADFNNGTTSQTLGDPKAGKSTELDALAAYVSSLNDVPASPFRSADGTPTASAINGRIHYARLDCATCHGQTEFTTSTLGAFHDVGTIRSTSGQRLGQLLTGFDTPSLVGLWATAPYLHDGSAATLEAVFNTTHAPANTPHARFRELDAQAQQELIDYLLEIDERSLAVDSAQSDFDLWAGGYELINQQALKYADPDFDGIHNFYEFSFGGSPMRAETQNIMPQLTLDTGIPTPSIGLSYRKARSGLTYRMQYSHNLLDWENASEHNSFQSDSIGQEDNVSIFEESLDYTGNENLFLRLVVEE